MLWSYSINLKEGRVKEFQEWTKKNEGLIQKHAPNGWIYRGTFGTVLGFGRRDATILWELNKYGDFDTWRAHDDETWRKLTSELVDFAIEGSDEAALLREIGDVRITEPKKSKK
jgi:hypothetical protein